MSETPVDPLQKVEGEHWKERFFDLIEVSSHPTLVFLKDGSLLRMNPECLKLFGFESAEGKNFFKDCVPEAHRQEAEKEFETVWDGHSTKRISVYANVPKVTSKRKDCVISWDAIPLYDHQKKPVGLIACGTDVTNQLQMTSELYRMERQLEDVLRALDESSIVAITDARGVIRYVNNTFCRISKYSREELIGKTHQIINSKYHSSDFFENMWKTIAGGSVWKGEIKNRAKDGSYYWVLTTIVPFLNESGEPYQYVAIRSDISEQKRLEEEVVRQDRLASIGVLASGLAHEIGTPLGVVRGRAEFIQHDEISEDVKKNLDVIIKQSDRISKLIKSLLRYSRSPEEVKISSVKLDELSEEVFSLLEEKFRKRNVKTRIDIPKGVVVQGDYARMEQIFLNLLVNALHAIEKAKEDGRGEDHEVVFESRMLESENLVELVISDTGCGMDKSTLKRAFQPFFTTKDIGVGTGLGLAIVEKLTNEIGAKIEVESTLNQGTRFYLRFKR